MCVSASELKTAYIAIVIIAKDASGFDLLVGRLHL